MGQAYQHLQVGNDPKATNTWVGIGKESRKFYTIKIDKLEKKDLKDYISEVDVEHPKDLHKKQKELPFLAEKRKIGKVKKLVPNLKVKKRYTYQEFK